MCACYCEGKVKIIGIFAANARGYIDLVGVLLAPHRDGATND
jgi:hypothetical protein